MVLFQPAREASASTHHSLDLLTATNIAFTGTPSEPTNTYKMFKKIDGVARAYCLHPSLSRDIEGTLAATNKMAIALTRLAKEIYFNNDLSSLLTTEFGRVIPALNQFIRLTDPSEVDRLVKLIEKRSTQMLAYLEKKTEAMISVAPTL